MAFLTKTINKTVKVWIFCDYFAIVTRKYFVSLEITIKTQAIHMQLL